MSTSGEDAVVIIGAGGHGREVCDIVLAARRTGCSLRVLGFLDDGVGPYPLIEQRGAEVLGGVNRIDDLEVGVLIGIGAGAPRQFIDERVRAAGRSSPAVAHPSATCGSNSTLGPGSLLWAGARVSTNVWSGRHVHINQNATVGHDTLLHDYVSVYPGAGVGGGCVLEARATIGTGAHILQGIRVGEGAMVGAGAVVIRDVLPEVTVVGVPARELEK